MKNVLDNSDLVMDVEGNIKNYEMLPKGSREKYFAPVLSTRSDRVFIKEDVEKCNLKDLEEFIKENGTRELKYLYNKTPISLDLEYLADKVEIPMNLDSEVKIEVTELQAFMKKIKAQINLNTYGFNSVEELKSLTKEVYEQEKIEFNQRLINKEIKPNDTPNCMWVPGEEILSPNSNFGGGRGLEKKDNLIYANEEKDKFVRYKGFYILSNAKNLQNAIDYVDYMLGEKAQRSILDKVSDVANFSGGAGAYAFDLGPINKNVVKWIEEEKYEIHDISKDMINKFFKDLDNEEWIRKNKKTGKEKIAKKVFVEEMEYVLLDYLTGKEFTDKELQKIIDEIEFKINIRLGEM